MTFIIHIRNGVAANFGFVGRERQLTARAVDFNRNFMLGRYVNFVQDYLNVPMFKDLLNKLALEDSKVRRMRGMLKMKNSKSSPL